MAVEKGVDETLRIFESPFSLLNTCVRIAESLRVMACACGEPMTNQLFVISSHRLSRIPPHSDTGVHTTPHTMTVLDHLESPG